MVNIRFPEPAFRTRMNSGQRQIFDTLRKKWVALTPEEWVRQNFINYLIGTMNYPSSLIAVEKELDLFGLKKRFDLLVYDAAQQPWMMIECKEESVKLGPPTLDQILRYNITIPVQYIVITSGISTYGWMRWQAELISIEELPSFGSRPS